MLKQTALYQLHLELGGRMTAFAGYTLPIQYLDGIIHEHLHCRSYAGFFDISHMGQCLILGDEAVKELNRLIPNDIAGLKTGQQKYTVLTNDLGGIIDDIIITRTESGVSIVVNAACKDKDCAYLKQRLPEHCRFIELDGQSLFALQGPSAESVIRKYSKPAADLAFMTACATGLGDIPCRISRCGYTGEDGFEISVANAFAEPLARLLLAEKEVIPCGLGARDTLRLEAGLCLYGHELNESITPVEAGLQWLVKKGCDNFPGADTIIKQLQQGSSRILVGLVIEDKVPVREGSTLLGAGHKTVGYVTSGSYAPSLGKPIALAIIDQNYSTPDTTLYAEVRGRKISLTITSLPFIPHRYNKKIS